MAKTKKRKRPKPIRLDLGCGPTLMDGHTPVDYQVDGTDVFNPLQYPDGSITAIRASHILEHCSHKRTPAVLKDWVRVLKPGAWIKIAVPDFSLIVADINAGKSDDYDYEAVMMGGHDNPQDVHAALFTESKLRGLMRDAGLIDITRWKSDNDDCSARATSLNLKGRKLPMAVAVACRKKAQIDAVLSVPRLGFNDHWGCVIKALAPLNIKIHKFQGAYWDQGLESGFDSAMEAKADMILTLDYDTILTEDDIREMITQMRTHPDVDAIAPMQSGRGRECVLFTMKDDDDNPIGQIAIADLADDLKTIRTAHFGATLFRTSSLSSLPRPWMHAQPNKQGRWKEGKVDADIYFWEKWHSTGRTLFLAPRVVIGHLELMIKWPDRQMKPMYQEARDYPKEGKPAGVWK